MSSGLAVEDDVDAPSEEAAARPSEAVTEEGDIINATKAHTARLATIGSRYDIV